MHFAERDQHDFRIYAGARETHGGFVAGVAVRRISGPEPGELPIIFREDCLSGGHCWTSPAQALQHALKKGTEAVNLQVTRSAEALPA